MTAKNPQSTKFIADLCESLDLPEYAPRLAQTIASSWQPGEEQLYRDEYYLGAAVYAVGKLFGLTLNDIAEQFPKKTANKKTVQTQLSNAHSELKKNGIIEEVYIRYICQSLNAEDETQEKAMGLVSSYNYSRRSSLLVLSSAAVYVAALQTGDNIRQDDVAEAAGVTAVGMRTSSFYQWYQKETQ